MERSFECSPSNHRIADATLSPSHNKRSRSQWLRPRSEIIIWAIVRLMGAFSGLWPSLGLLCGSVCATVAQRVAHWLVGSVNAWRRLRVVAQRTLPHSFDIRCAPFTRRPSRSLAFLLLCLCFVTVTVSMNTECALALCSIIIHLSFFLRPGPVRTDKDIHLFDCVSVSSPPATNCHLRRKIARNTVVMASFPTSAYENARSTVHNAQ